MLPIEQVEQTEEEYITQLHLTCRVASPGHDLGVSYASFEIAIVATFLSNRAF